jgi:hypothetical protein
MRNRRSAILLSPGGANARGMRRRFRAENSDNAQRVMRSMLQMFKIDIAALKRAQAA